MRNLNKVDLKMNAVFKTLSTVHETHKLYLDGRKIGFNQHFRSI